MFNRKFENLPVAPSTTAIALVAESGAALIVPGHVPKTVQRGVLEIMLAFPTPGMPDSDRRIVRDLYLEAVEGYPRAVVEWTLKYLVFNNPRNTPTFSCAPTPQDVREACKVTNEHWGSWVVSFYFGGEWATPSIMDALRRNNSAFMARYYDAQRGGKPGETDCIVPEDLQIHYLRPEIEKRYAELMGPQDDRHRRCMPSDESVLLTIRDDVFERMPDAAFSDGVRETIRAKRREKVEATRKAADLDAYLRSLSDKVRSVRSTVVISDQWHDKDETMIMAETDRRLEKIRKERQEADSEGRIFTGCAFADGSYYYEPIKTRQKFRP